MALNRDESYDEPDWARPIFGPVSWRSILERRSTIINDNEVVAPAVPPSIYSGETYRGKFFPRGCRGMLEQLELYCIGDPPAEVTLRYSPHPCIGPLGEVTIVPAAAWAWQAFVIEEMWNYDSLFIWVHECHADVDWGYDAVEPFDGHVSVDAGATWADQAIRPFIRAVYTGQTPGDVPVSGTINVVEIPSVGSTWETPAPLAIQHGVSLEVLELEGAGTLLEASLTFDTSVTPTAGVPPAAVIYGIYIFADGVWTYFTDNRMLTQSYVATFGRCAVGEFYQGSVEEPAFDQTNMTVRLPIKFRRNLVIRAYQSSGGAVNVEAIAVANIIR